MPLDKDMIASLYANRRTKGMYEDKLYFLMNESDEPGVDVAETWPTDFGKKQPTTLYQGFNNAAKKLEVDDQVDVVNRDGHVFILVKSRCELVLATDDTDADEE
jgi:hypothetical protein